MRNVGLGQVGFPSFILTEKLNWRQTEKIVAPSPIANWSGRQRGIPKFPPPGFESVSVTVLGGTCPRARGTGPSLPLASRANSTGRICVDRAESVG